MLDKAEKEKRPPQSIVAVCDAGTSSRSIGIDYCPTLTRARCSNRAYFSLNHGSFSTMTEMMRLQGMDMSQVQYIGPRTR